MPSRDLYKTDLERRLYAAEPARRKGRVGWVASLLGVVGGFGLAYWLYRRSRRRVKAPTVRSEPEFPEDDGSELAA